MATETRTGRCACGSLHYTVIGEPVSVHACHCTDCQKLSGSAFGLSMILNEADLRIDAGSPTVSEFAVISPLIPHESGCLLMCATL